MTLTKNEFGLETGEIIFRHKGEHTGFGPEHPIIYNMETGNLRIGGVGEISGDEFLHLADKVRQSRIRANIDPDPTVPSGDAAPRFVAMRMTEQEIMNAAREKAWENLPNYYPELQRELVRKRIPDARKVIEP